MKGRLADIKSRKEALVKEAYFNPVTNLPNKKNIQYVFDEQIGRTLRHDKTFTVLAIKINNYEQVKKTSLELANQFMYEASNIIIQSTRDEDLSAHIEEDTFIILFNEYLEGDLYQIVIDRLKKNFYKNTPQDIKISYDVSMGVSIYPVDGTDSEILLEKAIKEAKSKQF
ncbi:GGDEF domain-containing protein [Sulfurimonas sp. C5]|uniref:GGDEF domain-containing protein n=1 Tax=Sulfurimonas sp. C5 TaxID=3036947 RepID=UPI002456BA2B|nr:GGDEF domain-containing protein [Sulfurimonas sp. C5]MDH4943589.1 GGDEF domain-containing protein [Sulfurimonas sp. C5]